MKGLRFKKALQSVLVFTIILLGIAVNKEFIKAAESYVADEEGTTIEAITPFVITSGEEDLETYAEYKVYVSTEEKKMVIPVKFSSRGIFNFSAVDSNNSTSTSSVALYSDKEGKELIGYTGQNKKITKEGTYYLIITTYNSAPSEDGFVKLDVLCNFISGEDRKLTNKKWQYTGFVDSGVATDFEIKVTKAGTIKVEVDGDDEYLSYKLSLYSKDKKALTEETSVRKGDYRTFAVKKGTYYVRVTTYSNVVRVRYTEKAITDTSGESKAKASVLKIGKAQKGLVLSEDKTSKADWFKFTLTKASKIDIQIDYSAHSGKMKYELASNAISGTVTGRLYSYYGETDKKEIPLKTWTTETIPKGTYYLKIEKENKNTNGNYSIKIVNRK